MATVYKTAEENIFGFLALTHIRMIIECDYLIVYFRLIIEPQFMLPTKYIFLFDLLLLIIIILTNNII